MVILYPDFRNEEIQAALNQYDLCEIDYSEFEKQAQRRLEEWIASCRDRKQSEDKRRVVLQAQENDHQKYMESIDRNIEKLRMLSGESSIPDQLKQICDRLDRLEESDREP